MNNFFRRKLRGLSIRFWRKISGFQHVSLLKTIYFNFRVLPFNVAIHFPIYIYGKVHFYELLGTIEFTCPIKRGIVKFGYRQGLFSAQKGGGLIHLHFGSKIIFNGPCLFDYDYAIRLTDKGTLSIGAYVGFGNDTKIYCDNSITIGDYCRIPFGICFMDSNYHYSINTENGKVYRKNGTINIGKFNWIGNRCTINKGTVTPDGCIIASLSTLNKDYTTLSEGKDNLLIGGNPAKILKENMTRILSLDEERRLNKLFMENESLSSVTDLSIIEKCRDVVSYKRCFE